MKQPSSTRTAALRRWSALSFAALCMPVAVLAADVTTDVAFGAPPVPGYLGRVLQPVTRGDPMLPGTFELKAQLGLKQVPAMELESSAKLEPAAPAGRTTLPEQGVRLTAPADTDLSAYDELWVDHTAPGQCAPQLKLQTDEGLREGRPSSSTIVGMAEGRTVLFMEQPSRMPWVAKDMFYLLARQLGSPDDGKWRYAQDGDATVMQRRMQIPLERVQSIELEFPPAARLKGVNLFISVGDHNRPSRLLTPDDLQTEIQGDGKSTRMRIRLDRALAPYRQSGKPVYLAEALVFYQGSRDRILAEQPLRRVTVYSLPVGSDVQEGDRILQAPMKTAPLTSTIWRTTMDLKDVTSLWVARMPLRSAEWLVSGESACKVELIAAHLVKLKRSHTPAFVAGMASRIRALGGPFIVRPEDRTGVEWMDVLAELPLASARPQARLTRGRSLEAEFPGWGLRVASIGTDAQDRTTKDGLLFPAGAMVDMDWKVDFKARPGQRLHLDVRPLDDKHLEVEVLATAQDGQTYRFRARANHPLLLDRRIPEGVRVRSLALRFDALEADVPWSVRAVTVFRPYRLEASQLGDAIRPGWGVIPLEMQPQAPDPGDAWRSDGPRLKGTLRARPEEAGATVLRWTTPVDVPARQLFDLRLKYDAQGTEMDQCWMQADILGDRGHRLQRRLCSRDGEAREGVIADLVEAFDEDERVVEIRWAGALYLDRPAQLELQTSVGVGARPSVRSALAAGPVLLIDGENRAPQALAPQSRDTIEKGLRSAWVDYGALVVGPKQEMTPALLREDDLFELKRVTLISSQDVAAPAIVEWRESLGPPPPSPGMGKLKKLGLAFIACAAAWIAWRILAQQWRRGTARLQHGVTQGRRLAAGAWRLGERVTLVLGRHRQAFHLVSMAAALACFWWAGRDMEGRPWLLGAGVSLWVTAALHVWRGLPAWVRFFGIYLWPCMWFAWLAWALGAYPVASTLPSGLAILIGCTWPVASALHRSLWWVRRGTGLLLGGLLIMAALCYGLGFSSTADWGENLFITLGGLWMIAAWWFVAASARDGMAKRSPFLARWMYGERGGPFLFGAVLALLASVALLVFGMSQMAAHVVTLCFYQLCLGMALQASVHWRREPR